MNRNIKTPKNLPEYLEFFARETIRAQPKNILKFNKLFLEELEKHTDGTNITTFLEDPDTYQKFQDDLLHRVNADRAFSKETKQKESANGDVDEAAIKIQANVRGFLVRKAAEKKQ
ncbi:unnamed protein product [Auanema sp. JU1783]|nr:unnamed protein product [Auanema sp. JU1783]